MNYNENLILSPDLLSQEEEKNISILLILLQNFIKKVPVAHYDHATESEEPVFHKNSEGLDEFFKEDYSYLLERSSHTGVELVKMIRLFDRYVNNAPKPKTINKKGDIRKVKIWEFFTEPIPEHTSDIEEKTDYVNFVEGRMKLLDNATIPLTLLLDKRSLYDSPKFWQIKQLFKNCFRNDAQDPDLNYIIPQDDRIRNFCYTINSFRNKEQHWDVSPFNPPTDQEKEFGHYHQIHLGMVLYFMILFDRFYEELWNILVTEKDVIDLEALGDKPAEDSKRVLKKFYIKRLHKTSEAQMKSLFQGTGLADKQDLLSELPEMFLSRTDDNGKTIVGDCVDMLVDDATSKRKIVTGNGGSGKTVMFLRMIQRNQPMLTPFYIELKDFNTTDYTPRLERIVISEDRLIITKYTLLATLKRIHNQLESGSAVFFIDSAEAAPENFRHLAQFIRKYPECQYIIGTQDPVIHDDIKDLKFQRYEMLPFNEVQTKDLMRLMSMHMTGKDRTEKIYRKIRQISPDITNNPLTLTQLIYLYEKNAANMKGNLSRSMLFWNLYDSIHDEEDRQLLQNRQFMQQFFKNLSDIAGLCKGVLSKYNNDPKSDWPASILDFELVSSDLKQFFDLTEIMGLYDSNLERDAVIFKTLSTMAILEKDLRHCNMVPHIDAEDGCVTIHAEDLPMPNPALQTVALAIRDLPYQEPSHADVHRSGAKTDSLRITYRLQPKYILRQYLLSLLFIYKKYGADIWNSKEQIKALFTCIASSGDEEVLKEIFAPYWIRQWLINKNDISETESIKVDGKRSSPLRITLVENNASPHIFVLLLLRQSAWIDAKGMEHTKTLLEGSAYDVIVYHMNDEQREKLVNRLGELSGLLNEDTLGYYRNLTIASMDSIYLMDQYDRNNSSPLGDDVMQHLKDMGTYVPALSILTSCLSHLLLTDDNEQYKKNGESINTLLVHLVRNGILKTPQLRDEFWSAIKKCRQDYNRNIRNYLDKVPIEDILPEIALKAYDKTVWEHMTAQHRIEDNRLAEWVENTDEKTCKDLYLPVNKTNNRRDSIYYTFYSQPEDHIFIVATEWIDEMPEGKFCQIKGLDQWFFVEDVIILGKESELKHIAELTINLPEGAPRRRKGSLVIRNSKKMNYIHLFGHGTSRQVVLRIDNPDALSWLQEAQKAGSLKQDRRVLFNGIQAELAGVDIRDIRDNMRLVVLKPVKKDKNEYSAIPEKIDSIPMNGRLSFYHKKDSSLYLLLKTPTPEYQAGRKILKDSIYLGTDCVFHYSISETMLNVGNHLVWEDRPLVAEIAFCYTFDVRSDSYPTLVPSRILNFMDTILSSGKCRFRSSVLYLSVMAIHEPDSGLFLQEMYTPGSRMDEASIRFYHPVSLPKRKAWQHMKHKIEVDSVTGVLKTIENQVLIGIPKTSYPPTAAFYSTPELPKRLPIKWHTLQGDAQRYDLTMFIIVDPKVTRLILNKTTVQFFEKENGGEALGIRFKRITDMVDTANATRYHSSITPLLIKEWIQEKKMDYFRYLFCKNKQYLAKLIQECIHHGIPLTKDWAVRLYYVTKVKDNGTAVLFSPPENFFDMNDLAAGETIFNGKIPTGLKEGNMVIQEKDKLTILDDVCIREICRQEIWGFRKGTVALVNNKGKEQPRIQCPNMKVWFYPPANISRRHKGCEVIFFPVMINNLTMGKYAQIL